MILELPPALHPRLHASVDLGRDPQGHIDLHIDCREGLLVLTPPWCRRRLTEEMKTTANGYTGGNVSGAAWQTDRWLVR